MAIIKYKDKDGNLQPLGATGDHSHSLESLGAAAKDHPHDVATAEQNGFMSSGDKAALDKVGQDINAINTTLAGVGNVTEYVSSEIEKEKTRAEGAEGGLGARLDKIEKDYLTSANQTALEEAIVAAETSAVDTILGCAEGETVSADYNTLKKVADWIAADTENNGKLDGRIKKIEDDYLTSANEQALSKTIGENTASIGSIQTDMATKVSQEDFNALSAIVNLPSGTITEYVSGEIKKLDIDKYAEDKDLTEASNRIDALEKLPQTDASQEASGFMSANDKKKLDGIASSANNYKHPNHTAAESGLYKVTVDSEGHVTDATKVEKSDITGLGIPAKNTEYDDATKDKAGLMSTNDKTALDAISAWVGDIGDDSFSEIVADINSQIAGKVPHHVKENVNFNELKDPGFYIVHSSTQNKPYSGHAQYSLIVVKSDKSENAGHQIAIPYSSSNIYIRAFTGTNWYNWKQISLTDHTHKYAGSNEAGGAATSANKVNNSLTIQLNGGETEDTNKFTFDGSGAKTLDIKPSTIGALSAETKSSGTFDEITTPGVWSVSNSVTGGPVSKKHYTVIVGRSTASSSTWLHQIAIIESTCEMYIRYKNSDGWKAWQAMPYNAMTGATSSADGSSGVVPAPSKGDQNKFLKGNGSWSDLPTASTTAAGMMSSDDKSTLDAIGKWVGDTSSNFATIMTGYAASSHGNHVPTTETANNAKFLRNDNTWQTVTPANIGALTATTISSGSFNDIKKPGIYAINGIKTNAPTNSSYWTLIVGTSRNQTGNYVHQIAIREGSYDMYIRYFNNSSWSSWIKIKPEVMTGATSSANGAAGLVPQPTAGNQNKYLKANGTWDTPTNTTYSAGTGISLNTSTNTFYLTNPIIISTSTPSVTNGAIWIQPKS